MTRAFSGTRRRKLSRSVASTILLAQVTRRSRAARNTATARSR